MNVIAGRRPVGVLVAVTRAAVFTTPPKGAVRRGAVLNENPHCTARAPSLVAMAPGYIRASEAAPVAAAYRTIRGSPYEKRYAWT